VNSLADDVGYGLADSLGDAIAKALAEGRERLLQPVKLFR
jgi:hypothetical protein